MKFAILTFPGSNCQQDVYYAISNMLKQQAEYVPHTSQNLDGYDAIILPGGSSYGDALRPGALAAVSPIVTALRKANEQGKKIIGICNGFQILTEAKLLPGVLLPNPDGKFICKTVPIKITKTGQVVQYPIAHANGRYYCNSQTLQELQDNNQIIFTYENNINDSVANIAGVVNKAGNVLGLMPHPERALYSPNADGLELFKTIIGG